MKMHDCFAGLLPTIPQKGVTGVASVTPAARTIESNELAATNQCNTSTSAGVQRVSELPWQHLSHTLPHGGVSGQAAENNGNYESVTPVTPETPWREHYEERAAIMQYSGGFPRDKAEVMAYWDTFAQFAQRQHPALVAEFESLIHQPLN